MRRLIVSLSWGLAACAGVVDADPPTAPDAAPNAPNAPNAVSAASAANSAPAAGAFPVHKRRPLAAPPPEQTPSAAADAAPARFSTEEKWELAGYNNDEVVYTIIITSHDTRIIRCSTLLSGSYFENGTKTSITDRQSSTVLPNQQIPAGNWIGMDKKSGATYSVKCHAL